MFVMSYLKRFTTIPAIIIFSGIILISCRKNPTLPAVTTDSVTDITSTSAVAYGIIEDDGGAEITSRGFCWSTSQYPSVSDDKTDDGAGTGIFSGTIAGLEPATPYFLRAYAVNSAGITYGDEISFNTEAINSVEDIDGNIYPLVTIGEQVWMAENLRVTRYRNGDIIQTGLSGDEWRNITSGALTIYSHEHIEGMGSDAEVLAAYGALYNWFAVADTRGLCPAGWHVPSDDDWLELAFYLSDEGHFNKEGRALKSLSGWNNNGNGTDDYGFSALPGGSSSINKEYYNVGLRGNWWSSTETGNTLYAYQRAMSYAYGFLDRGEFRKNNGLSVRCLKD